MNLWSLPKTATIGGVRYEINADFRDVLEIIGYLNDNTRPAFVRWQIALALFYEGEIPKQHQEEAIQHLSEFIGYGSKEDKPGPKLIDWEQDAQTIVGDVNKVAGVMDIRDTPFLHWWTFLSYFYSVGEGQLSTIVSIRSKKQKGTKLEKWEEAYYRDNKDRIDFKKQATPEDKAVQEYFSKWL